jgi:hypothetical protein
MFGTFSVIGTSKVIILRGFPPSSGISGSANLPYLTSQPTGWSCTRALVSADCVLTQLPASLLSCPSIQYIMCSMNASWPVELRTLLVVRTSRQIYIYLSDTGMEVVLVCLNRLQSPGFIVLLALPQPPSATILPFKMRHVTYVWMLTALSQRPEGCED